MSRSKATVTTASTLILPEAQRRGFVITNPTTATEILYLAFGEDAVVGEGLPLSPGQSVTAAYEGEFNLPPTRFDSYSEQINGIYATETNSVPTQTI